MKALYFSWRSEDSSPILSSQQSEEFEIINYPAEDEEQLNGTLVQRTQSLESAHTQGGSDMTSHDMTSRDDRVEELSRNLNNLTNKSNMDLISVSDKKGELMPVITDFITGLLRNSELHLETEQSNNCSISMLRLCVNEGVYNNNNLNDFTSNTANAVSGSKENLDNFQRFELMV